MKEFFGFGGYSRPAEGFFSWQHLTFVTALVIIMTVLAVVLGRKNRLCTDQVKNRVLIGAAIAIDSLEIFKIVILCLRSESWSPVLGNLPLFLCSIQLISLPMAAFCKGKLREAALDFVAIFGLLGALAGTYGAGNNYGTYPVLSMDNVVSGLTHCISGFAALYIMIAGMAPLVKRNIPVTCGILLGFCLMAYGANSLLQTNYMFLVRGDGTPYDILYNLVGGSAVWYPLGVVGLFFLYIGAFYGVHGLLKSKSKV